MADIGPVPDVDPVQAGRARAADVAEIVAQLAAPNPHASGLPESLLDDGGTR